MERTHLRMPLLLALVLCLAAMVGCSEDGRDSSSEPALLPDSFTAGAESGSGSTQVSYEGFIAEPNPAPSDGSESSGDFTR